MVYNILVNKKQQAGTCKTKQEELKMITLKNTFNGYYSDGAEVKDYHEYEIYSDSVAVGTIETIDQFDDCNDTVYVERIDISDSFQGKGIGTEVLTSVLKEQYSNVVVAPDNARAKTLYARIGEEFTEIYGCDTDFGYNDQGFGVYVI